MAAKGLSEDTVRMISAKKNEPAWLLEFRLKALRHWLTMKDPAWAKLQHPPIDFQNISYYAAPKKKPKLASMDEVDPELLRTFERVQNHPELVQKYLGTVVPAADNFYAALNSAVFTDGSFCYIPKGVKCPMDLSTYFRINTEETGQFERTLIVAEEGASVSYLEGCTAPKFDTNQLHAAGVELVALDQCRHQILHRTEIGTPVTRTAGGIYNFVTKRGLARGVNSRIAWTQVETGSAITWKYPSCILQGDNSVGEFYSVAVTNHHQQADTGTKMIHPGKNTRSTIVCKGISADGPATATGAGQGYAYRQQRAQPRSATPC
ncbi:SufD family Fe-S cluster assembly protein [Candidatus Aalborgicola defluviihabitans]|uniref:SufD family Fe-S cluster assembly protein n=1 Tax=Candidatus Aalborgicola defluviihabitans TaxID=3386187 RepID=UPI0039B937CA